MKKAFSFLAGTAAILGTLTIHAQSGPAPTNVVLISASKVDATFAKGGPLLENREYKIQAGHRDGPGNVELHYRDTDIFHFMEGSGTLVTGGTVTELKNVGPGEFRGKEIQGGETRHVTKGDVIVIPKGTPHWFKEVNGPLNYYVVKVTALENREARPARERRGSTRP